MSEEKEEPNKEEPNVEKLLVQNYIQQKIATHEDIMDSICHSFQMSKLEAYTIIERFDASDPKNWDSIDYESPKDLKEDFLSQWISERDNQEEPRGLFARFIRWLTW